MATLAEDVGRLRAHIDPESYSGHLAWRIAGLVGDLLAGTRAPASELVRLYRAEGVTEAEAIELALETVDRWAESDHRLLGFERDDERRSARLQEAAAA